MPISQVELDKENPHKNRVHTVLAHSYAFHFCIFLLASLIDFIIPLKLLDYSSGAIGLSLMFLGTVLIFWAQSSSKKLSKENMTSETFSKGPYRYMRSPTNLGIFLAFLGFGVLINSFFISAFSFFSFFTARMTFIKKQEKILEEKYGAPYLEYKKKIRF